jgi:OmpA-OmpF porin, OOP family
MHYVLFDLDDSRIRPGTRQYLDTAARFLKAHPGLKFEIGVHFDQRYSKEHSRLLSQQRADSLLAYFYSAGVDTVGFAAYGYQGEKPILTKENLGRDLTEKDYSYNRRTELKIILKLN